MASGFYCAFTLWLHIDRHISSNHSPPKGGISAFVGGYGIGVDFFFGNTLSLKYVRFPVNSLENIFLSL